ncbi:MAG: N-acetyltransferase [Oligoflexia bacterium]|nr:N-acetyltransferase [Oligoflexia bacterium]
MQKEYFVHESCYVDEDVIIGRDTKIWHFSHILKHSMIGCACSFGQNCCVGPNAIIGNNVKVQNNVSIYEGVEIEDDVFLGPSMVFTNVINPRSFIVRKNEYKKTLVCQGATIGANATIVCGIRIGKYAFVGAGSVITKDVPDFALVYGAPAKIRGWMSRSGSKLIFDQNGYSIDAQIGEKYKLTKHDGNLLCALLEKQKENNEHPRI